MPTLEAELAAAKVLDAEDPLRAFRERFVGLREDLIYLDGNSLGPLPKETLERVHTLTGEEWGGELIRSWNKGWFDLPLKLGDQLAPLIGASPGEVCFADSVTVNLFKLISAVALAHPERRTIVTDDLNFPSDHHALEGLTELRGTDYRIVRVPSQDGETLPVEAFIEAINEDTLLVTTSHVCFKSGFCQNLEQLAQACRAKGTYLIADVSHSVGAVPIHFNGWGVDMAVGCSYKFLNGGPGAPAFLYVRKDLQATLNPGLKGWFGASKPFDFAMEYAPEKGIRRFLTGTPPILSMAAIEPGITLLREAGMERLRSKSVQLTEALIRLWEAHLKPLGFSLGSPRDPQARGSHVALRHPDAYAINLALIQPSTPWPTIIPDFRAPDNLRIGIAPLYNRPSDVVKLISRLLHILQTREHDTVNQPSHPVT
jgi:kynureninase